MDYQEFAERGQRARRETEDFINSYIHDHGKRWPTVCHFGQDTQEAVQRNLFGACSARLPCQLSVRTEVRIPARGGLYR
jgi:hypothetical protein